MNIDYSDAPAYATILAILCIVVGVAIATGGYRYRRAAMAASALFAAGSYVIMLLFAIDERFLGDDNWYFLTFFGTGIVFGTLGLFHAKTGVVVTGFCAGVALVTVIVDLAKIQVLIVGYNVILTLGGVICAVLTLLLKKPGLIAATSFVGASVFMDGVRFFVFKKIYDDDQKNLGTVGNSDRYNNKFGHAWWTMIAILFALFAVAVAVQVFVTARGIDYDEVEPADSLAEQYTKVETPQQQHGAKSAPGASNPIGLV